MSEFIFGYKSPTHEINIQVPVCLLGKPDPDVFSNVSNLVTGNKQEKTESTEEKSTSFFGTRIKPKEEKPQNDGDGLTIATGLCLVSAMILAALKD